VGLTNGPAHGLHSPTGGIPHDWNTCLPPVVLNLRRGCITFDTAAGIWLMEGLYFKGAEDEDGNKIPAGAIREEPWVVIELVSQAVEILERLHESHLLFSNRLKPIKTTPGKETKRRGEARADRLIADDRPTSPPGSTNIAGR